MQHIRRKFPQYVGTIGYSKKRYTNINLAVFPQLEYRAGILRSIPTREKVKHNVCIKENFFHLSRRYDRRSSSEERGTLTHPIMRRIPGDRGLADTV